MGELVAKQIKIAKPSGLYVTGPRFEGPAGVPLVTERALYQAIGTRSRDYVTCLEIHLASLHKVDP